MKLVLTDFYHQPTQRFLSSLDSAGIKYTHVNITYDGWQPVDMLNPFAAVLDTIGQVDRPLYYNQIKVPEFYEIRNLDGSRSEILDGDVVRGYIYYAPNTPRLVREVQWLDRSGKQTIAERYNRQGFKFADALFNSDGREVKTIYYTETGEKILTVDTASHSVVSVKSGKTETFQNLTAFALDYVSSLTDNVDEILFNSLSTPFFVSNQLSKIPGTLYFQEVIREAVPGNMTSILEGKTPTTRVLFENAKELAKVEQLSPTKQAKLSYLGAIEHFRRENKYRPKILTITRSDQIEFDEDFAAALTDAQWTIAAPSEVSDKLRSFANAHANVSIIEALPLADIDGLLASHDIYLDVNKGNEVDGIIRRAYLEGLLVVGYKPVIKNPGYELVLETEQEIIDVLKRPDKQVALKVLREKRGKQATAADYRKALR